MRLKDELEFVGKILEYIENDVIKERVSHLIIWYCKKSTYYKRINYFLAILVIVINSTIPVINQSSFIVEESNKLLVSSMSALASIIGSIAVLLNVKDTWYRYRKYCELMKTECILFINKCEKYSNEDREQIFVIQIEKIITDERNKWEISKFKNDKTK